MKFYHRTTEQSWQAIQKEGCLWGITGFGNTQERIDDKENRIRYTYLAPFDWGESYGTVLLEVEYEPKREDFGKKHNYGFDPPTDQQCVQFCVFEPIYLDKVKRL